MSRVGTRTVTIASGQTVSGAVSLGGASLVGIITPAALTGTTLTFQASADGTTYVPVYTTAGVAASVTVAASRYTAVPPTTIPGAPYLKVVSGSAEGADRTITLVVQE